MRSQWEEKRDFAEHVSGFNWALPIYQSLKLYILEKSISVSQNNPHDNILLASMLKGSKIFNSR